MQGRLIEKSLTHRSPQECPRCGKVASNIECPMHDTPGGTLPRSSRIVGSMSKSVLDVTVGDALRLAAKEWGSRTALVDGGVEPRRRWSFVSLLVEAERVARVLLQRFSPGSHVALCAGNSPEWILIEYGAAIAGIVLVNVNPASTSSELEYFLRQSRACGIIVEASYRGRYLPPVVASVRPRLPSLRDVIDLSDWSSFVESGDADGPLPTVKPGDIAQIQYTSGTTGSPKGAVLTHRGLTNNARFYAETIGARPDDVWINPMPLFHTAGCGLATLGSLQTGGRHVVSPDADTRRLLSLFESEQGSVMLCVPTILMRILNHPDAASQNLASWRLCTLGGAPVPPELIRRSQKEFGLEVAIGFGQTEASSYITHTIPHDSHPHWAETVGRPLPQTEVRIVDPHTGLDLPPGAIGEVQTRGYGVMTGYFDDGPTTSATITEDGWLRTGDLGSIDEWGYCRIHGRLKDMLIRGGENICPREIEDVLFQHAAVANAAVLGLPDPEWGEVVAAFVQLRHQRSVTRAELEILCRERLASHKVPRRWVFLSELPQTASGKIKKYVLRADAMAKCHEQVLGAEGR
jgi:fatty-acyl-CoA synthase